MDSKVTGGPTSGVRVFTVFVLSGSLFLLIYNIGRRRMNLRNSYTGRETSPVIGNPSSSRGYFSHHMEKPLAPHRKPSLLLALENSASIRSTEAASEPSDGTDQAGASSSGAARENVETNASGAHDSDSRMRNGMSSTFDGNPDDSNSVPGHEGHMIDHMRRNSRFNNSLGLISSNDLLSTERRRSSSSFLGDMSQLETVTGHVTDTQIVPERSPSIKSDFLSVDSGRPRPLSPQAVSITPQEQFFKPILYMLIWCVLSYSFHVYSTTGLGAKMTRFPAPFLKTTLHFLMQFLISFCMLRWPRNRVFVMPWSKYLLIVIPIATAAALDRDLQDASVFLIALVVPMLNKPSGILQHAYMMFSSLKDATLETAWDAKIQSKGYVPLWLVLFALAFRLESRSVSIVVSITIIAVGFILTVTKGMKFGVMSLKESSVGPFLSGFRWAATQLLLQKRELGMITPVVTMRALSPSVAMVAALFSIVAEPWSTLQTTEFFDTPEHALKSLTHISIGALLATALALAELVVVYHTSALTLVILGMLKDLCVVVPKMYRDEYFSEQNMLGVVIFSNGLICLIWLKYQQLLKRTRLQTPQEDVPSVAAEFFTGRWPGIWTPNFASFVPQINPVRGVLQYARDGGMRLARKFNALRVLAS